MKRMGCIVGLRSLVSSWGLRREGGENLIPLLCVKSSQMSYRPYPHCGSSMHYLLHLKAFHYSAGKDELVSLS